MISNFYSKKIFRVEFILMIIMTLIVIGISSMRSYIHHHPEKVLLWSESIEKELRVITLPMRMIQLSTQPPDEILLMPVYGVNAEAITDTWAAPRSGGRLHEGQDIFAEKGTPIFSATAGYIVRIQETELGGNTISVVGPGGRSYYYAHLDRYAEGIGIGDKVTTDTIIGYVGNTGNAINTPSHLHFGMYQRSEGAINPLPLLKNRMYPD